MPVWEKEKENKAHLEQLHLRATSASDLETIQNYPESTQVTLHPQIQDLLSQSPKGTQVPLPTRLHLWEKGGEGLVVNAEWLSIYQDELLESKRECFNREHLEFTCK